MLLLLALTAFATTPEPPPTRWVQQPATPLYAAPDASSTPIAMLPWGTQVTRHQQEGRFDAVQVGPVSGYVAQSALDSAPPEPTSGKPSQAPCSCYPDAVLHQGDRRGLDLSAPYCVHPYTDDESCVSLRPNRTEAITLAQLERSHRQANDLNLRQTAWLLAFAPESPYRHTARQVLNHSPLLGDFDAIPPARQLGTLGSSDVAAKLFNSTQLSQPSEPPEGLWLFQLVARDDTLTLHGTGGFGFHGPDGFPAMRTRHETDAVHVSWSGVTALYEPCTRQWSIVPVQQARLDLVQGTVRVEASAPRQCEQPPGAAGPLMLIDTTSDQRWVARLTAQPGREERNVSTQLHSVQYDAHQVVFGPEDGAVAYLRSAQIEECGADHTVVLQLLEDTKWRRLSSTVTRAPCAP